ncbi:phenylacetic acid degradation operon negative regulatory protein PaaX [Undibacterium sp. SXout7W]|uniref:phenylacetic acid degradation operon negative regulatory protein PaaX n=1 Tax=Undibacterium sp. SXout7W TaxID=3413049 RepID=UPI003BF27017
MQSTIKVHEWISQLLEKDPPRAKSLVMTLFGDAIDPHGGSVWLGSLISLMGQFGISDRLVRTSVFRLTEEGWLEATRDGRRSSYKLAAATSKRFQRAYRRIYTPSNLHWDGNWTLVFISTNELSAAVRGMLKKELLWEGYCMISQGIFAHPLADREVLEEIIERTGLKGQLFACRAVDLKGVSQRPLSELINTEWELDTVNQSYQQFIEKFSPLLNLLRDTDVDGTMALIIRTLVIHSFRRTQLHDPQLPVDLLPASWLGTEAYTLCHELYQACFAPAEEYLMHTLRQEDDNVPAAASQFYKRFGGLIF